MYGQTYCNKRWKKFQRAVRTQFSRGKSVPVSIDGLAQSIWMMSSTFYHGHVSTVPHSRTALRAKAVQRARNTTQCPELVQEPARLQYKHRHCVIQPCHNQWIFKIHENVVTITPSPVKFKSRFIWWRTWSHNKAIPLTIISKTIFHKCQKALNLKSAIKAYKELSIIYKLFHA